MWFIKSQTVVKKADHNLTERTVPFLPQCSDLSYAVVCEDGGVVGGCCSGGTREDKQAD